MTQKSMSFSDVTVGRNDYRIHFGGIAKSEAMNRRKNVKNVDNSEKKHQKP